MADKLAILVMARNQTIHMAYLTSCFMDKYWSDRNAELILCTQTQTPKENKYDRVIYTSEGAAWGDRMAQAARRINSEYVLFTLEDFFISENISNDGIEAYINLMDSNPDISAIRLFPSKHFVETYNNQFDYVKKGKPYRICGHPTIYRREYFVSLAEKRYSPWQFEIEGSKYSESLPGEILVAKNNIYHCIHAWGRGSWTRDAIKMFKRERIDKSFYENDPVYPLTRYLIDFVWGIGLDIFPKFFTDYSRRNNRQN